MKTTKELARELGLLRKRTYSTSSAVRNRGANVQQFKYLIVIDFESTCWQDIKYRPQEIIEFPAVLLNTISGKVESEFHYYVQPQEYPVLSQFCTELTGIVQSQVDNGIPVNLCLRKFTHWLDKLYREQGVVCEGTKTEQTTPINCTFVTWSDWDLGVCLQYECKRKQLLKPAQLNTWIDLRATYRKFYERKPNGLNGALQDLGIEFQGREHSGVDDARNTAKLAYRMITDGCILKNTKTLKTHQRSSSCNVQFKEGPMQTRQTSSAGSPRSVTGKSDIRNFVQRTKSPARQISKRNTPKKTSHANSDITPNSKSAVAKPQSPKQIGRKIPTPNKKSTTPNNCHTPKRKETCTPNSKQSRNTPNSKLTPAKCHTNCTSGHCTVSPKGKQDKRNSPANSVTKSGLCSNNSKNIPSQCKATKTPIKRVEEGLKRKMMSPIRSSADSSCMSPSRKVRRRISPMKLTAADIYRDPEARCEKSPAKKKCIVEKPGLQECDMNIKMDNIVKSTSEIKKSHSGSTSKTLKRPSPLKKSTQPLDHNVKTPGTSTFKVPLPVNRISPKKSQQRKSFTASTPATDRSDQPILTPGIKPSPIQAQYTPFSNNRSTSSSSHSMNKTPASFITPSSYNRTNTYSNFGSSGSYTSSDSQMKVTPPLCNCGRRSKRRMVQSPGQNMGRFFFTCTVRQSVGSKKGCDFFKWESSLNFNKNTSARNVSKQYTPVLGNKSTINSVSLNGSGFQKRSLGVRSNNSQRVYLR